MKYLKNPSYYPNPNLNNFADLLSYIENKYGSKVAFKFKRTPKSVIEEKTYSEFIRETKELAYAMKNILSFLVASETASLTTNALLSEKNVTVGDAEDKATAENKAEAIDKATIDSGDKDDLTKIPKVGILGDNSYFWRVAYMATAYNDALVVPFDRLLKYHELKSLMDRAKPVILFYGASYHDKAMQLLEECASLKLVVCMNKEQLRKKYEDHPFCTIKDLASSNVSLSTDAVADNVADIADIADVAEAVVATDVSTVENSLIDLSCFAQKQSILFEELVALGERMSKIESYSAAWQEFLTYQRPDNVPSLLLFTSGTTEESKGILLSQNNICHDINSLAQVINFGSSITSLSILPLHHTFENTCGFLMMLYLGGTIADMDGLRYIADNMKEYKPDILIAVPLMFEHFYNKIIAAVRKKNSEKKLLRGIKFSQTARKFGIDLRRRFFTEIIGQFGGNLRYGIVGAAPCRPEMLKFFDALGIRILEGYGLTETAPVVAGCNTRLFEPGTVGHALAGIEIAVDNDNYSEAGEILVKGKNVMLGYFDQNGKLDRNFLDEAGWFHTGDLGVIDTKTECLKITGRVKSMIVLENGKKVFPEEIENLLKSTESAWIKEVLVFPYQPSNKTSAIQISAAFILDIDAIKEEYQGKLPSSSEVFTKLNDLIQNINQKLPLFKNIRYFYYSTDEMIKTTTLKVKRKLELIAIEEALNEQNADMKKINGQFFSRMGNISPFSE